MNIKELKTTLKTTLSYNLTCTKHEDKVTPMVWGPPGIGKSDIIYEIAEEMGYQVVELRLASISPVDARGFPDKDPLTGKGAFLPPYYFPVGNENKKIIIFLDEINTALPTNQTTAYELCQNYSVGGKKLPNEVLVVAAGNREEDGGATYEMPTPLANRFQHLYVGASIKPFVEYAFQKGIHEDIIGFLQFKPTLLHAVSDDKAFPTPRSWVKLSNISKFAGEINQTLAASLVGIGAAGELMSYISVKSTLPDLDDSLQKGIPFQSSDRSVMYAFITGIIYRLNKAPTLNNLKSFVSIMSPLATELKAVAFHMLSSDVNMLAIEEDYEPFFKLQASVK